MRRNHRSRSLSLLGKADDGDMPSPFHGHCQLTLMTHAISGNAARNDTPPLRQEIPEQAGILEIDRRFIQTKSAGTPSLKQPTAAATFVITSIHTASSYAWH
jgi:hypothetical protein